MAVTVMIHCREGLNDTLPKITLLLITFVKLIMITNQILRVCSLIELIVEIIISKSSIAKHYKIFTTFLFVKTGILAKPVAIVEMEY
jgi:hypothetical protein